VKVVFLSFERLLRTISSVITEIFDYWAIANEKGNVIRKAFLGGKTMGRYSEIKQGTAEVVALRAVKRVNTRKAHAAIRDLILQYETLSYSAIAKLVGVSRWLIYSVAVEFGVRRPRGAGSPARIKNKGELE
jgi:hypothetical protein